MRINPVKSFAFVLAALVAVSSLGVTATASADTVEVIEHNATIVVNGWKLKADEISRRSDGVVKAWGNAHASNDSYRCAGAAEKIVLNTGAGHITFHGGARVEVDHVIHVGEHGAGLKFDYRHDHWDVD